MSDLPEYPEHYDKDNSEETMPFVVIKYHGGVYEDRPFVAGYQMGRIHSDLESGVIAATSYMIYKDLHDQADLIGMMFGYTSSILWDNDDAWVHIGFTRADNNEETWESSMLDQTMPQETSSEDSMSRMRKLSLYLRRAIALSLVRLSIKLTGK